MAVAAAAEGSLVPQLFCLM